MDYQLLFVKALSLTVSIELGVGIILKVISTRLDFTKPYFKTWHKFTREDLSKFLIGIFFASCLTLPYIWFIFPKFNLPRPVFILVAELFAWLGEAIFYHFFFNLKFSKALFFSLILNTSSFLLGLAIIN